MSETPSRDEKATGFEPMPFWFGPRMSLGFSAQFLFIGLYLPYFPVWLKSKDLTSLEISTILALPLLVRVLASGQVMVFADGRKDRANVLTALYMGSVLSICLYLWTDGFWPILFVTLIYNFFFNPILPLLDAVTLAGVRRFDADYGKTRLWGSLVFILANLGGGALLAGFKPHAVLIALVASIAFGGIVSFLLPRIGRKAPVKDRGEEKITRRRLLADRTFLTVLAASGLAQASHALLYGFGSIHWQALGIGGITIGMLWAIGVIAEIILFQYSSLVLRHVTPAMMIAIGCVGGLFRWLVFPMADGEIFYFLLQVLHGLSFGAVHIGTMQFIMHSVPEEHIGAAQGVGYVLGGVAMGVAVFLSGPIYNACGANGFWFMAGLCLIALLLLLNRQILTPREGVMAD